MKDIEIIKPGLFTTIQDSGRVGTAYFAVPSGGAMDRLAFRQSNLIVDNSADSAAIECTLIPPHLLFHQDTYISLTGANLSWMINGVQVDRYQTIFVRTGSILSGKPSKGGVRAYIGIGGKINGQIHFGSYSTYTYAGLGGVNGKALSKGECIEIIYRTSELPIVQLSKPQNYKNVNTILFQKGPEWDYLTDAGKKNIQSTAFKISPDSNRMGARLVDNKLESISCQEMKSVPVFPGVIQLPRSGDPIVILQDGQTTGGYPRIGIIGEDELNKFNQLMPGAVFNFALMK